MPHKKYWFPAKKHGLGWGLPITWQGWIVFLTYLAVVIISALTLAKENTLFLFLAIMLGATGSLVAICWRTGEPIGRRR